MAIVWWIFDPQKQGQTTIGLFRLLEYIDYLRRNSDAETGKQDNAGEEMPAFWLVRINLIVWTNICKIERPNR